MVTAISVLACAPCPGFWPRQALAAGSRSSWPGAGGLTLPGGFRAAGCRALELEGPSAEVRAGPQRTGPGPESAAATVQLLGTVLGAHRKCDSLRISQFHCDADTSALATNLHMRELLEDSDRQ